MKATTKFLKKTFKRFSRGGSQQDDDSSRRSSRRRSVSEMGSSDSDRSIRRDQNLSGLRGCSSRFSVEVNDVLEPPRRLRTRSHSKAQAPEEMNIDDEDERWNYSPEGFSLRTSIEEQRLPILTSASGGLGAPYGSPCIAVDGSYHSRPSEQASSSDSINVDATSSHVQLMFETAKTS